MRRKLVARAIATLGICASATTAHAVNLPVSYLVFERDLKLAVGGTPITFELHDEPTCAVPEYTTTMGIDTVHVIERLKSFQPKGGAKRPKQARLQHVLVGVEPPSPLYLRITGTGIAPYFPGDCQLQASVEGGGTSLPCASQVGNQVTFEGCNVNIRNGAGSTAATNGLGNLVVGYNEDDGSAIRIGSHNVVVGQLHTYTSSAGLIVGKQNVADAPNVFLAGEQNYAYGDLSSVSGGTSNTTFGTHASVTGGIGNTADASYASVTGGQDNTAGAIGATVSGGDFNDAQGPYSVIAGGSSNGTSGAYSVVSGGTGNGAQGTGSAIAGGANNIASGSDSFIGGGWGNAASGSRSSVTGGQMNHARSTVTSVLGGQCNVAGVGPKQTGCTGLPANQAATVTGGFQNLASGNHSSVNGGNDNTASGGSSVVGGGNTITQANGFGWSAGSAGAVVSGRFVSP